MKEWKVLRNISGSPINVTAGGNIYKFGSSEMKIVLGEDAKFIVEKYLEGPLGQPKFEFVNGKDIPQEFVNQMLKSSDKTKILINKFAERIEMMYGGIKYIFKKDSKVVLDSALAELLQSRSWSQKAGKYMLEFASIDEKKEIVKEEKEIEEVKEEKHEVEKKEEKKRGRPKKND